MTWTNEFGSVFFLSIATILTGSFGLAIRYCLRSKCQHFTYCWSWIDIDRNVRLEASIELETNKHDHTEEKKGDEAV
jgi:hypothetical protein